MVQHSLTAFAHRLRTRRDAILHNWRARVADDPKLVTGTALPAAELNDHLTALLEDFERRLCVDEAAAAHLADDAEKAEAVQMGDAAAHGLHRWQQGYDLAELARELGRFNESVVQEIDRCSGEPGLDDRVLLAQVHGIWAAVHSVAVSSSAEQFARLQQMEAAGHLHDLEAALQDLRVLEAHRGELWRQAAHDLRGNLSVVQLAAGVLARADSADLRARFLTALDTNVRSLAALLEDVTSLARLQGGLEVRTVVPFDVGEMLHELAGTVRGLAEQRKLQLQTGGPHGFVVEGDPIKTRRVVQNLLLNALRYTQRGGVQLSWGDAPGNPAEQWYVQVQDTGPGLHASPGAAVAGALNVASEQSRRVQEAESRGEVTHVTQAQASGVREPQEGSGPADQTPGEGIGLSIVKRLCGLLDATIEVDSTAERGTTFRVVLPRRYDA